MPVDTDAGADTPAHANEGDTSNGGTETASIDARINKAIVNHLGRFEKRIAQMMSGDLLGQAVANHLERMVQATPPEDPAAPSDGAEEPQRHVANTALQAEVQALRQQVQAQQRATEEARQQAKDERLRSIVQGQFAQHLGQGSPWLKRLLDSTYDVERRFDFSEDGTPVMKIKRDWGEERVPITEGVKEFFATEAKDLLPARNGGLPPAGYMGRGMPMQGAGGQYASTGIPSQVHGRPNPFVEVGRELSFWKNVAPAQAVPANGTDPSRK